MKQKNKILIFVFAVAFVCTIVVWILGHNPILFIVIGIVTLFLLYVLWDLPPKHKDFSYEDQQRAMRAFDRSKQIDMGKPDWAKGKKKQKK
jgi:4-hydroxybenzoate polyprenyltransferase